MATELRLIPSPSLRPTALGRVSATRRKQTQLAEHWARRAAALLVALFGALCAWHGVRLAASVVNPLPATGWSAAWQYLPAACGGALIALFALLRLPGAGSSAAAEEGR